MNKRLVSPGGAVTKSGCVKPEATRTAASPETAWARIPEPQATTTQKQKKIEPNGLFPRLSRRDLIPSLYTNREFNQIAVEFEQIWLEIAWLETVDVALRPIRHTRACAALHFTVASTVR